MDGQITSAKASGCRRTILERNEAISHRRDGTLPLNTFDNDLARSSKTKWDRAFRYGHEGEALSEVNDFGAAWLTCAGF
jgi:hypothetical protein